MSAVPWWRDATALAVLAANCVPLAGVLLFGWSLFAIMFLFWLDSVVIGLVSIARYRLAIRIAGGGLGRGSVAWQERQVAGFAFGYFFFTLIQGLFVIILFGALALAPGRRSLEATVEYAGLALRQPEIAFGVLAIAASRCYELYADSRQPHVLARISPEKDTVLVRVIVLQLVILLGGGAAAILGAPLIALVALVLLKCAGDIVGHAYGPEWRAR